MPLATRIFLSLAAFILLAIGGTLALAPQVLHPESADALATSSLLASDLRSSGSLLVFCASALGYALWRGTQVKAALGLTALVFLGYGCGRLVGLATDGDLSGTLALVTGLEWVIGIAALFFLWRPAPSLAT